MKELIYVTGQIDTPFFTNEIGYFCKTFDKVHVVVYGEEKAKCEEVAEKFGFSYEFVNTIGKRIASIPYLLEWRNRDYVKDEFRCIRAKKLYSLKTAAYIYLYGIHAVAVEKIVKQHLKKNDELYLYSFWLSRPAFAIASMNNNRNQKIKRIVSRTHRYDLYEEENSLNYLPFRRFISENLDTIYFSSKDTYEYYANKAYSDKIKQANRKLLYLGTNNPPCIKKIKNSQTLVIASCAYIMPRKRLDLIIKVVDCISKLGCKVKWIHIGNGEMENQIKKLAESTFTTSDVEYIFTGKLSDEEIYQLYESENVDFFINMSDSEGIPVSVLEALSMGIPCIARNVGGNAEAIIDGFNGILIEKNQINDEHLMNLSKRVVELFRQETEYQKISKNANEHWKHLFSGECNYRKICEDIITSDAVPELQ